MNYIDLTKGSVGNPFLIKNWKDDFDKKFVEVGSYKVYGTPDEHKAFIETLLGRVIDEVPATPKAWKQWSIERQLGYNKAVLDLKQQLKSKYLPPTGR